MYLVVNVAVYTLKSWNDIFETSGSIYYLEVENTLKMDNGEREEPIEIGRLEYFVCKFNSSMLMFSKNALPPVETRGTNTT